MRRKLQGKRWLPVSLGAMVLAGAALAGTAHGAGASPLTTHRGVLPPVNPPRSMAPETPLLSSCGPVPSDAIFTWAKAKKLLGIR